MALIQKYRNVRILLCQITVDALVMFALSPWTALHVNCFFNQCTSRSNLYILWQISSRVAIHPNIELLCLQQQVCTDSCNCRYYNVKLVLNSPGNGNLIYSKKQIYRSGCKDRVVCLYGDNIVI